MNIHDKTASKRIKWGIKFGQVIDQLKHIKTPPQSTKRLPGVTDKFFRSQIFPSCRRSGSAGTLILSNIPKEQIPAHVQLTLLADYWCNENGDVNVRRHPVRQGPVIDTRRNEDSDRCWSSKCTPFLNLCVGRQGVREEISAKKQSPPIDLARTNSIKVDQLSA
ncbi:hypothetical protein BDV28DRAFT_100026 [Aspergillus coremiiformis]|uniref:Uncharacterized protein n=1 Tax=Aspergillus coremiiformis TaxID=138285 RepID=A0A5N6Z818_9EURO|nr:hypothetical protein BDV28DRAFT_100026 [Aspergillus coremiiformis]